MKPTELLRIIYIEWLCSDPKWIGGQGDSEVKDESSMTHQRESQRGRQRTVRLQRTTTTVIVKQEQLEKP